MRYIPLFHYCSSDVPKTHITVDQQYRVLDPLRTVPSPIRNSVHPLRFFFSFFFPPSFLREAWAPTLVIIYIWAPKQSQIRI